MTTDPDLNSLTASGDRMELLQDETWHQKAIEAENLIKGDIIAGVPGRRGWMMTWSQLESYAEYMQVRSMVLRGFAHIISEANFGVGQEAAITCGKHLVFERMTDASLEVQEQVLSLIDWQHIGPRTELTPQRLAALKVVFQAVMTPADWQAITNAAAQHRQTHLLTLIDSQHNVA